MITWCTECGMVIDGQHSPDCYWVKKRKKQITEYSNTRIAVVEDGKIVIKFKEK